MPDAVGIGGAWVSQPGGTWASRAAAVALLSSGRSIIWLRTCVALVSRILLRISSLRWCSAHHYSTHRLVTPHSARLIWPSTRSKPAVTTAYKTAFTFAACASRYFPRSYRVRRNRASLLLIHPIYFKGVASPQGTDRRWIALSPSCLFDGPPSPISTTDAES